MDFFDFLFGKKVKNNSSNEQDPSNNKTEKKVSTKPINSGLSPVEQCVLESVTDLKQHTALST